MANIDGIDKRIDRLENGTRHPPLIVWEGHECSVKPKPGQDIIRIAWGKPEPPPKHLNEEKMIDNARTTTKTNQGHREPSKLPDHTRGGYSDRSQ